MPMIMVHLIYPYNGPTLDPGSGLFIEDLNDMRGYCEIKIPYIQEVHRDKQIYTDYW